MPRRLSNFRAEHGSEYRDPVIHDGTGIGRCASAFGAALVSTPLQAMGHKQLVTVGRTEHIALPGLGFERVASKIDTGAYRGALHYQKISVKHVDGGPRLMVLFQMGGHRRTMLFRNFRRVNVKSSNGNVSERYLVRTLVTLGGHSVQTQFTLFDRSDMKFQVLLGRKFLSNRFVVDVSKEYCLG